MTRRSGCGDDRTSSSRCQSYLITTGRSSPFPQSPPPLESRNHPGDRAFFSATNQEVRQL
ncbi:hypothetical protein [Laspinema olomoucense]|uniref:hypothetical protein n=1 Tax=Laspinema olomoucense TaxID=3231600 RepID=UPI0021BB9343|nr:hypothetical protein [Laspinema sp. D3a]MCT7990574.1 hypothetical protein [Laspinema sp. D3a]